MKAFPVKQKIRNAFIVIIKGEEGMLDTWCLRICETHNLADADTDLAQTAYICLALGSGHPIIFFVKEIYIELFFHFAVIVAI